MKIIESEGFFHISRENRWNIGDTITAGLNENPFWLLSKDFSPALLVNNEAIPLFEVFEKYEQFDLTQNNIDWLYTQLKTISKETAFYIRERVFEDVRKEFFPHLPSRQKCLWVSKGDQLPYWRSISPELQRTILKLDLNGDIFCADDYWLQANTLSSIEYTEKAKHYWSGEIVTEEHLEYLFSGTAVIKEIINLAKHSDLLDT